MAGAIAGTALVNYAPDASEDLTTVTLTVNNLCNLECPHCYLQYSGSDAIYISDAVLKHLYNTDFRHLVIVGKEPFVNSRTVSLVREIVKTVTDQGRTVGIITNGTGLDKFDNLLAERVSYIDVSFDGGPLSYNLYRKSDFQKVINNIRRAYDEYGFARFNALHVISNGTIGYLDDMISVKDHFPFRNIMFSPYLETLNDGSNTVSKLRIGETLSRLSKNELFLQTKEAFVLLDVYHLIGDMSGSAQYSEMNELPNMATVKAMILHYQLESKVKLIEKDPIRHGFVRLTYDGYLLSPYASLNPAEYQTEGIGIDQISMTDFFHSKAKLIMKYA